MLLAVYHAHVPGSCFGNIHWSATTAGSGQSVLAGVLAGFVFAGIVAVLSRGQEAARALKLMFCAFLGLAVVAYLLADQAADTLCLRASAEETLAGGILGAFAIIMLVSLTWLVVAYELQELGVLRFLRRLIYVASLFVVLLLCTSSYSCLQEDLPNGASSLEMIGIYAAGFLFYAASLPVISLGRSVWAWVGRRPAPARRQSNPAADTKRVNVCAWTALAYLGVAAIGDAVVVSMNDSAWSQVSGFVVQLVAWSALLLPLGVVILALRALAPEVTSHYQTRESGTLTGTCISSALAVEVPAESAEEPLRSAERPLRSMVSLAVMCGAAYGLIRIDRWRQDHRQPKH